MASSGYAAWSVIAGEQPTTAKWNILGTNDASFNTGNGFNDGIIVARHMAASSVNNAALDTTTNGIGAAWQSWTPTVTNNGGTITSTVNYAKYIQVGKIIIFRVNIQVNSISAAGALAFTVPVTAASSAEWVGTGREDAGTGKLLEAMLKGSSTVCTTFFYDNTGSTANTGYNLVVSGMYEAA